MSETIYSTGGTKQTSSSRPKVRMRLFGIALAIFISTILTLLWGSWAAWQRVEQLQHEFTGLQADNFYFGVRIKSSVLRVSDRLLRYRLEGKEQDRDGFLAESKQLENWLESFRTNAVTPLEREFSQNIWGAYQDYRTVTAKILVKQPKPLVKLIQGKDYMFPEDYQAAQAQTDVLVSMCDGFIQEQRSSFDTFLVSSHATLSRFKDLLLISVGLVVVLACLLLMLMYRGMIAPLRRQLIESHATIARQEKLASLGSLAAGVAHEIRNPLTAIRFRLFSLKQALPGSESESEDVTVIASELDRLERIVQDFLRFARPSEPELVSVPAQRLLREVFDLLQPQLAKNRIELKLKESDPMWVQADTHQIKQVMINLIQNAADSVKADGRITLSVRPERSASRSRNGLTALEVSDTGKGIPKDLEERLFDPFFTTKDGGTGLGLPIAARIVEKHGGLIRYRTNSQGGATFSVILPHVEEHETNRPADRG